MTLTVRATPGGTDSNSYGLLSEAEDYFAGRPGATAWTGASTPQKNAALVAGTMRIEQEEFDGYRASEFQALRWPRFSLFRDGYPVDPATVPSFVKAAAFEEALAILKTPGRFDASVLAQFNQLQVGPVNLQPRAEGLPTFDLTPTATRLLAPYRTSGGIGTFRVNPA